MLKHAGAAIAACLYIAGSAWLVGSVGEAYRESLKQAIPGEAVRPETPRGAEVAEKPSKKPSLPAPPPAPVPSPVTSSTPPALARSDAVPSPATAPEPRPVPVAPPPAPAGKSIANDTRRPPVGGAAKTPGGFPDLTPIDPFFASPRATRRWAFPLKPGEEAELGRDLKEMVLLPPFNRRLKDGKLERRVYDAARPLEKAVSRKEVEYSYVILDSKNINAFSHPGGHVYVTKGLLDWISEDEDYVLQFALAHEIYHVDREHALRCLQDPGFAKMPYGTVSLFYLFIFPVGYRPEAMDYDADAWATRQLMQRGHSRRECLKFLRMLDRYEEEQGSIEGHQPPLPGDVASLFENHYRAHPAARKRLERAERLFAEPTGKAP